ncbi:hypothetical protein C8J57DRAFT_1408058 [Mycena rebaudengoi]|nr:hypothetical protein C8J57DRAFT_1408058 [Mycena rebaudengoi]
MITLWLLTSKSRILYPRKTGTCGTFIRSNSSVRVHGGTRASSTRKQPSCQLLHAATTTSHVLTNSTVVILNGSGPHPESGSTGASGCVLSPNSTIHLPVYVPRSNESRTPASQNPGKNPQNPPPLPMSGPVSRLKTNSSTPPGGVYRTVIFLANPSNTAGSVLSPTDAKIHPSSAKSPWGTVVFTMRLSADGTKGPTVGMSAFASRRLGAAAVAWMSSKSPALTLGNEGPAQA